MPIDDAYNVPLFNANINGPKENAVALGLDGRVAWVEPSDTFAMGYRVPAEIRDAGESTDALWRDFAGKRVPGETE